MLYYVILHGGALQPPGAVGLRDPEVPRPGQ